MKSIKVSICCVTYNQLPYIERCLQGFVSQKTDFPFEILVHDDASTDGTTQVVKEFEKRHPHLFRNVYQSVNQFKIQNTLTNILFRNAKGDYIALCEGDDYWTDPYKLQKQVDFLETNPEYTVCFHPVQILNESTGLMEDDSALQIPETTSIIDLAKGNFIHTPSVVFRNGLFAFQDPIFAKVPAGDYLIHLLNARKGLIKKLEEPMAVYRKHDQGIWSIAKDKLRHERWVKMMDLMIDYFKDDPKLVDAFNVQRAHSMTKINDTLVINKIKHFIKKTLGLTK